MNKEIKEIYLSNENSRFIGTHDNMGCVIINGVLTKNITYEEYIGIITKAKYFILVDKDYITNLEQENKNKDKEIERLKGILELRTDTLVMNQKKVDKLQDRIDKAIKLLKEAGCYEEDADIFCSDIYQELPELLYILQGEDKGE